MTATAANQTASARRSAAIDPAETAHKPSRSHAGAETEAERDAATRVAEKATDDSPKLTPEQAKMLLLDAARAFDPLKKVREHPFVVLGTAAAAGAVLGSSGRSMFALSRLALTGTRLVSSLTKVVMPLSAIVGQYAAGHAAAKQGAGDVTEKHAPEL